jgi:hypothetical protein
MDSATIEHALAWLIGFCIAVVIGLWLAPE